MREMVGGTMTVRTSTKQREQLISENGKKRIAGKKSKTNGQLCNIGQKKKRSSRSNEVLFSDLAAHNLLCEAVAAVVEATCDMVESIRTT